jgi:hypothetical protein
VELDDAATDRQTETRAQPGPPLAPIKHLENALLITCWNTGPGVADFQPNAVIRAAGRDFDFGVLRRVQRGVF